MVQALARFFTIEIGSVTAESGAPLLSSKTPIAWTRDSIFRASRSNPVATIFCFR
jgi:hypothetical protein